ncbi:hypothetical protein HX13_10890 [Chryseobacterium sp. P1-3]|nr:hypothetical protein HX13_10890 [Chryseobacterium sp. P1-3]
MNFFYLRKDRKRFVNFEMYRGKCTAAGSKSGVIFSRLMIDKIYNHGVVDFYFGYLYSMENFIRINWEY